MYGLTQNYNFEFEYEFNPNMVGLLGVCCKVGVWENYLLSKTR